MYSVRSPMFQKDLPFKIKPCNVPLVSITAQIDEKTFVCPNCGKVYNLERNLKRHIKYKCQSFSAPEILLGSNLDVEKFECDICGQTFSEIRNLRRHIDQERCSNIKYARKNNSFSELGGSEGGYSKVDTVSAEGPYENTTRVPNHQNTEVNGQGSEVGGRVCGGEVVGRPCLDIENSTDQDHSNLTPTFVSDTSLISNIAFSGSTINYFEEISNDSAIGFDTEEELMTDNNLRDVPITTFDVERDAIHHSINSTNVVVIDKVDAAVQTDFFPNQNILELKNYDKNKCNCCKLVFKDKKCLKQHLCPITIVNEVDIPKNATVLRVLPKIESDRTVKALSHVSKRNIVEVCLNTSIALPGVFPCFFPGPRKDIPRLKEIGLVGDEAYKDITNAVVDEPLTLPTTYVIRKGDIFYLIKDPLTIPNDKRKTMHLDIKIHDNKMILTTKHNLRGPRVARSALHQHRQTPPTQALIVTTPDSTTTGTEGTRSAFTDGCVSGGSNGGNGESGDDRREYGGNGDGGEGNGGGGGGGSGGGDEGGSGGGDESGGIGRVC